MKKYVVWLVMGTAVEFIFPTIGFEHHKGQPHEVHNQKQAIYEPTIN